jgi:transposase
LRAIARFIDLNGFRWHLAPFYSATGRPSIDPDLMIRMLIVDYCFGIRSERRLCEEVHLNLACRLGLEGKVPDHSTFSKNRHGRFRESDAFRHVFETVVRRCIEEGLVGGEGFAVDASLISADANKQRSVPGSEDTDWRTHAATRRSVQEYLDTLDEAAWGAASETVPKFISRPDPAAQWTGAAQPCRASPRPRLSPQCLNSNGTHTSAPRNIYGLHNRPLHNIPGDRSAGPRDGLRAGHAHNNKLPPYRL